ncbi:hypothetical protein [Kribbella sp. CA-293567]|uniref:hypothetical protein n=1 Tax=Kribbella sp. CA-293567 TaxID=3002436 RepID=UPI0022DE3764|nr:hypothetical protein [Kribbella sp. CA-293567]WBQ07497.1 hypothetical protein OX958_11995 [Kribbella sp. CA-293567]
MMSVLAKVSPERRLKTGWILPVAASTAVSVHLPGQTETIQRTEQLWFGGLGLAGVAIGLLWQWYSPRDLAPRLFIAAGGFVLVSILQLLPTAGEWNSADRQLYLGLGVVSGLVLANWWKWLHTADDESAGA